MDSYEYQVFIVYSDGEKTPCGPPTRDQSDALETFRIQSDNAGYRSGEVQLRERRIGPWRTVRVAERQGVFAGAV